ncbi:MAG: hypothetical protein GF364_15375 [Candidatus Lokiarchaeota archaeon]|nr:hypothetical protein [Candidatus Lokiarchaeota archaeon]
MDITIPSKEKDLVQYIWKTLSDEPFTREELIYKISFKMNLPFKPTTLNRKIKTALEEGFLQKQGKKLIPSDEILTHLKKQREFLKSNFSKMCPNQAKWDRIEDNYDPWKIISIELTEQSEEESLHFIRQIKKTFSKEEMTSGRRLDRSRIHYKNLDEENMVLEAEVDGSHGEKYKLVIDVKNKKIIHDCEDFIRHRMNKKEFCKHFFNTVYELKEQAPYLGITIIESIKEDRDSFKFSKN